MKFSDSTGVVVKNSIDYVEETLNLFSQGKTVINLISQDDKERLNFLSDQNSIIVPDSKFGWSQVQQYPVSSSENVAQVLFSSGTEGKPKAILLSFAALSNTADRLISVMEMTSEIREYIGVPVYYSFGFGRCRAINRVGGKYYIPQNGFNPLEISEMLLQKEINSISAVPTLWRLLLTNKELFERSGEHLKWIEIGSQYMSGEEKKQLKMLFPHAKIIQHYGLTEASRSTFLKIHEVSDALLESVGKAELGVEISISQEGMIRVRGPHLASTILSGNELQAILNDEGWFVTNDIGFIRDGYLFYQGRNDDVINCGGIKLSPDLLEKNILEELKVSTGVVVCKKSSSLRGEIPVIAYLSSLKLTEKAVRDSAVSNLNSQGVEIGKELVVTPIDEIPMTETGKVKRKLLSKTLSKQETEIKFFEDVNKKSENLTAEDRLIAIWEEVLKIKPVSIHDSFFELGGDSLSAISVAIKMEKMGLPSGVSQKVFQGMSIAQILDIESPENQKIDQSSEQAHLERKVMVGNEGTTSLAKLNRSLNIVRALLVLINISAHWVHGLLARLPYSLDDFNKYLSVVYSSGTPGFAIVFGAGVGAFMLPRYIRNPRSVSSTVLRNSLLLGGGILCLSLIRNTLAWVDTGSVSAMNFSNSFYSVLIYYFYAVLTIPIWLRVIVKIGNYTFTCLLLATVFYWAHLYIDFIDIPPSSDPVLQHFVLMLTAKYNYFEMSTGVFIGIAFGEQLKKIVNRDASLVNFFWTGCILILVSIFICYEMGDLYKFLVWPKGIDLWSWPLYAGASLILVHLTYAHLNKPSGYEVVETLSRILNILGIMVFPLFIGHEMVIPTYRLLAILGVPFALPIVILIFLLASAYLVNRLYRIYYKS